MSAKKAVKKTAGRKAPMVVVSDPELAGSGRADGAGGGFSPQRDAGKEDAAAKRREAAFESEHEWSGVALHGFSSGRESIFSQLRLCNGAPPLEQALEDVDGFFADAIRVLYLCSHEPADWRGLRAKPLEWQEAIEEWADEAVPKERKGEAILLAMTILTESYANQHEVKTGKHAKSAGK